MSFRQFAFGLTLSFGIAWLAVVIVPFLMMRHLKPVHFDEKLDGKKDLYFPKRTGRVANGAEVYAANGCYHCHSQLIRPSYAGNDLGRPDWAGIRNDEKRGDTRRESNIFDYQGEKFAQIGQNRLGPDLSIIGRRVEVEYAKDGGNPKSWLMSHLYNPRANPLLVTSVCPAYPFLFNEIEVKGQVPADAVAIKDGKAVMPSAEAEALVEYLLSLKRDDTVPASMANKAPVQKGPPEEKKP